MNYTNNDGDSVKIDSTDLYILADEIDTLENDVKSGISTSLTRIGQTAAPTQRFSELFSSIEHSQDIKSVNLVSVPRNLSEGCAAWVEGRYIVGTGEDNQDWYQKGYADGFAARGNGQISYTYHQHTGSETSGGGCYTTRIYHSHDSSCYTQQTGWWVQYHRVDRCPTCGNTRGWDSWHCDKCGAEIDTGIGDCRDGSNNHYHSENNPPDNRVHVCGSTLTCTIPVGRFMGYKLGCGKKAGETIESATIVFP